MNTTCLLGKDKTSEPCKCTGKDCRTCGWEKTENERRKFLLAKYGLRQKANGTMGLILVGVDVEES